MIQFEVITRGKASYDDAVKIAREELAQALNERMTCIVVDIDGETKYWLITIEEPK